ncbi:hypothetical protein MA16_Dca027529 [Dendrobium catenatum]|uniref:Uncharacterized protein n=1 Tax=Dendrobium catenatum TaxID=906689 RepID=A0A2I0W3L1_9ASPA|nr:hypothetical protein MA16_Dca027529 [Dendrobium catenatum]
MTLEDGSREPKLLQISGRPILKFEGKRAEERSCWEAYKDLQRLKKKMLLLSATIKTPHMLKINIKRREEDHDVITVINHDIQKRHVRRFMKN